VTSGMKRSGPGDPLTTPGSTFAVAVLLQGLELLLHCNHEDEDNCADEKNRRKNDSRQENAPPSNPYVSFAQNSASPDASSRFYFDLPDTHFPKEFFRLWFVPYFLAKASAPMDARSARHAFAASPSSFSSFSS
jgi:hypothetical protein